MHPQSTTLVEHERVLASIQPVGKARPAVDGYGCLSYARQSKSIQATIDAQHRCNQRTAQRLGQPVRRELSDTESGLCSTRPGYQELLELAATGEYRYVLLYKADRLTRDDEEFVRVCRRLLRMGMHIEDYTIGPITEDNVSLLALLAYMELKNLSERTKMKLEDLAASGTKLGRGRVGYTHGDRAGTWVPDPVLGPLITELFQRADAGESLGTLRHWYNEHTGRKAKNHHIVAILRSEYYMGLQVCCKTTRSRLEGSKLYARPREDWKVTKHSYPLIDEQTWQRVQQRLDGHKYVGQIREQGTHYALTGIIWCERCNRRMQGVVKERSTKKYMCRVCSMGRGLKKTESAVLRLLAQLPLSASDLGGQAQRTLVIQRAGLEGELTTIEGQIAGLTNERVGLARQNARGVLSDADYAAAILASDKERDTLYARRASLQQQLEGVPTNAWAAERIQQRLAALGTWTDLAGVQPIQEQQELYRLCCKAVRWLADGRTLQVQWTPEIASRMPAAVQEIVP